MARPTSLGRRVAAALFALALVAPPAVLAQSDKKVLMAAGLASAMLLTQALLFVVAAVRFKRGRLIL